MTKHTNTDNDIALDVYDVAKLLRIRGKNPARTIRSYALKGLIKGRKINRDWRFHPQAITDFLMGKP